MSHTFVKVIAAVRADRIGTIPDLIHALGNPARDAIGEKLDRYAQTSQLRAVHFTSLNVFKASSGDRGHLVLELSGDGNRDGLLEDLASLLGEEISPIFALAIDRGQEPLAAFWKTHVVAIGQGSLR